MKISRNHRKQHHHHEKKQFNSLINVLRPKVYITDSSTFKNLVQQLTGLNAAAAAIDHHDDHISLSSSSLSSPLPSPETQLLEHDHDHHKVSIIDIDHPDDHYTDESNSCMETTASSDYASVDSFHHEHIITSSCNMQQPVSYIEEVKQLSAYDNHDQMYYENQLDHDHDIISEFILMNQQHQHQQQEKDFLDNYDVESWLLDMEPCPNISYNGCYPQIQQEVSIYDYELSAVI